MAIDWTQYKVNSREVIKRWTTHEGLVVSESWTREVRAMSDVYCDVSYVNVWNPETKQVETVSLGYQFECNSTYGHSTIDASDAVLETIKQERDIAARAAKVASEARRVQQSRQRAQDAHNRVARGKTMRVVAGRKVRKGTVGQVFWMDDLRKPTRVGLDLTGRKDGNGRRMDVAWVAASYLVNDAPLTNHAPLA
jgi:hypothetical protein